MIKYTSELIGRSGENGTQLNYTPTRVPENRLKLTSSNIKSNQSKHFDLSGRTLGFIKLYIFECKNKMKIVEKFVIFFGLEPSPLMKMIVGTYC